jgi:hypothetical protein
MLDFGSFEYVLLPLPIVEYEVAAIDVEGDEDDDNMDDEIDSVLDGIIIFLQN